MTHRLYPEQTERNVLAACLYYGHPVDDLTRQLEATHLYGEAHRWIYEALRDCGPDVNTVVIRERLKARGRTLSSADLLTLAETPPIPGPMFDRACQIIRSRAALRALQGAAQWVDQTLKTADLDEPDAIADELEGRLSSATAPLRRQQGPYRGPHSPERLASQVAQRMEGAGRDDVFVSSWPSVDLYSPTPVGPPLVIGAETGVGKSAVAISLAERWAAEEDASTVYIVAEDSADSLHYRHLAMLTGTSYVRVAQAIHGGDEPELRRCIQAWEAHLCERPGAILWDDTPGPTAESISVALRHYRREGYTRVVVDHLREIKPSPWMRRRDRHEQIADSTKVIRDAGLENNLVTVLLSQLKQGVASNAKPTLNDYQYSSAIQQVARMALIIRRPHAEQGASRYQCAECWVVKASNANTALDEPARLVSEPSRFLVRESSIVEAQMMARAPKRPLWELLESGGLPYRPGALRWPGEAEPVAVTPSYPEHVL